ncbi:transcription-repair coupling factor [Streptococcus infantis SK1302]|uniref:Transcription-repair coupling factor n=1 Tax=Streptococcus infantis SK1302 TaxID=871237 RepID=A0ABN0B5Q2_9STRE|nr:transcription-repair coupling factor [Streptococcus infantis SK1302]
MGKGMSLIEFFLENKNIQSWNEHLSLKQRQLLLGLSGSAKSLAIASSAKNQDKILVMTSTYGEAERLVNDLISILGSDMVYPFLVDDSPMVEFLVSSQDKIFSRVEALRFLRDESQKGILVCNLAASRLFLPDPQVFDNSILKLEIGQECEQSELKNQLISLGYKKVTQVQSQGEFSLRGDILDIFETSQLYPNRIEFFGDEIDGIREFDAETQLSKDSQSQVLIYPASDILLTVEDYHRGQQFLEHEIDKTISPTLKSYLEEVFSCAKEQVLHVDIRKLLSVFYKKQWTLIDYLNQVPIIFDDFQKIMTQYDAFDKEIASYFTEDLHNSKAVSSLQYFADVESQFKKYVPATFFSNFQKGLGNLKFHHLYQFNQYPMQEFFNQFSFLKEEIERYKKLKYTIVLQSSSKTELKKLSTILDEYDIKVDNNDESEICKGTVNLVEGNLRHGFHFVDENLVFITEYEIFKKKIKRKYRRQNISNAERLKDYNDLQKGDYVVHQIHGIGQYLGIETIEIKGIHRDYVSVLYQNGDRISIPVEQIQTLSKYVSSDGKAPKLNKLNDGRFKKLSKK